jgi:succinyl-diaminopimelate desuccinylase
MSQQIVSAAQKWLAENEDALLGDLRSLLQIPSLEEDALPNAPFGQGNRDALDFMLDLSQSAGMSTTDMEGFCGYADTGAGDGLVMVLGHLDVVPVSAGWKHEPFGAEVDDGWIYARGAVDDKGPTMAAFYAAKAIMAVWPELPCRLRMVYGCNEESGFKCIEHYMKTEESPTFGVAPDAGWPLIHAEKGIADFIVEGSLIQGEMELLEINGGQRPNIVIDECHAKVCVADSARAHVDEKLTDSWDKNLEFSWDGDVLSITAYGKAAHGSIPYWGDNAAIRALRFLKEISPLSCEKLYEEFFALPHLAGRGMGISDADEVSGLLSANLGIIETIEGRVKLTINVRYPVTSKGADLRARNEAFLAKLKGDWGLAEFTDSPPLYFDKSYPMVNAITEVYTSETGETPDPGVMGGGTYARAVPNTVAIGTGWAGDGPAHENDERLKVEHLHKMARIYVHILVRLATLAGEKQADV